MYFLTYYVPISFGQVGPLRSGRRCNRSSFGQRCSRLKYEDLCVFPFRRLSEKGINNDPLPIYYICNSLSAKFFRSDLIGTLTIISRDIYQEFGTVNRPKRTLDAPKWFSGVLGIKLC
jgi:hypothetical protein